MKFCLQFFIYVPTVMNARIRKQECQRTDEHREQSIDERIAKSRVNLISPFQVY